MSWLLFLSFIALINYLLKKFQRRQPTSAPICGLSEHGGLAAARKRFATGARTMLQEGYTKVKSMLCTAELVNSI